MNRRLNLLCGLVALLLITTCFSFIPATPRLQAEKARGVEISSVQVIPIRDNSINPYPAELLNSASAVNLGLGSISGRVFESDGTTPIAGAVVRASASGESYYQSAITNSVGSYSMTGLPDASYTVRASAQGYISFYYKNTPSSSSAIPLLISASRDISGIDFKLITGGSISGHYFGTDGVIPVADASISVESVDGRDSYGSTKTAADGSYRIGTLYPRDYTVQAYVSGHITQYYSGVFESKKATTVSVKDRTDTPDIDFIQEAVGAMSGHIYQADGKTPISGVGVYAALRGGPYYTVTGYSSSDGSFFLKNLPSGNYLINVNSWDYLWEYYNNTYLTSQATPVAVIAPNTTTDIDFTLGTGGSISGHVYQPDGHTPIANVYVSADQQDGPGHRQAVTNSDGSYSIPVLYPGNYRLYAYAEGYLTEYYHGKDDYSQADQVTVVDNQDTPDIDFTLDTGGAISGLVFQEDGTTPIADAYVSATRQDKNEESRLVHTSADGSYIIENLPSGNYILYSGADEFPGEYFQGARDSSEATPVTVNAPDTTICVNFRLKAGGSISGRIYLEGGNPPQVKARISARTIEDPTHSYSVDAAADGSYQIKGLSPGEYFVGAGASGYLSEYYQDNQSRELALPVLVALSQNIPDISFVLDKACSISGYIYQSDGKTPVYGATVSATLPNDFGGSSAVSQFDGNYFIGSVRPGKYTVSVKANDFITEYYDGSYDSDEARPVTVTQQSSPANINFKLDQGGAISGHVFRLDGTSPVANANLSISSADNHSLVQETTSSDGSFFVGGLIPGGYRIHAFASDYMSAYYPGVHDYDEAAIIKVADQVVTGDVNLIMHPGGSVSGHVYQADGTTPFYEANVSVLRRSQTNPDTASSVRADVTRQDGSYTVTGLPPGEFVVVARVRDYVSQYYNDAEKLNQATPVSVALDFDTPNVDFALDPGGSISGHVFESDGKTPIAYASVGWKGNTDTVYTAMDGSYTLTGLPAGSYQVFAGRYGYTSEYYDNAYYLELATPVSVTGHNTTANIDFTLDKSGSISGRIYGPDGRSLVLSECSVNVIALNPGTRPPRPPSPAPMQLPGTTGLYSITDLPPGDYKLNFSSKYWAGQYYGGVLTKEEATIVRVTLAGETTGIDFILQKGGTISGHVYEAGGTTPIADAEVSAARIDGTYSRSTSTGAQGGYSISHLPAGKYLVKVEAPGYVAFYDGHIDEYPGSNAVVSGPDTTFTLNFFMAKFGSISGRIFKPDGKTPVSNVTISLCGRGIAVALSTTSQEDGTYQISGLPAGNYELRTFAKGYISRYYGETAENPTGIPVPVIASEDTSGIEFVLDAGASISGHIYAAGGNMPVAGADIEVKPVDYWELPEGSGTSGQDGNFIVSGIVPGDYRVIVRAEGYIPVYYGGTSKINSGAILLIAENAKITDIDIWLDKEGKLSGFVYQSNGNTPISGMTVELESEEGYHLFDNYSTTDSQGKYIFSGLPTGNYSVRTSSSEHLNYLDEYYPGVPVLEKEAAMPVVVTAPGEITGINFSLDAGGTISGRVIQSGGTEPLVGAYINVRALNGVGSGYDITRGDDGYFINRLSTGLYLVSASLNDGTTQYYGGVDFQIGATLIEVTAPGIVTNINFNLDSAGLGSISGHLSRPAGTEVIPLEIQAYDVRTHIPRPFNITGSHDGYTINALPAGNYLIRISDFDIGYNHFLPSGLGIKWYNNVHRQAKAVPVTVVAGKDTPGIDFTLEAGGTISGQISNSNGTVPGNTKIEVFGSNRPDLYAFCYADKGVYSVGGLPDGKYKVRITASGYACRWNGQAASKQQAKEIVIKNASTVTGIDFTLVPDNVKPTVVATLPAKNAVKVKVNSPVKITFSEEMDTSSVQNGFFLYPPAIGKLDLDGKVLIFTPANKLAYGKTYTLTLASDIKDTAGNMLGAMSAWNFTTEAWPTAVVTRGSTILGDASARLHSTVAKPAGAAEVEVFFEWGPTTAYGNTTTPQVMKKGGNFSFILKDLLPRTTYHFRAVARGDGTVFGKDKVFTTLPSFKLNLVISGQGSITPAAGTQVYLRGSTVEISAIPAAGWKFEKWTGGVTDPKAATTTVTLNRSKTITAVFKKIVYYNLTLEIKGQGAIDPPAGIHSYAAWTQVVITASPATGWKFSRWSTGASGKANPLTLALKSNRKINAIFVPDGTAPVKNTPE